MIPGAAQEEMNRFLRGNKILEVQNQLISNENGELERVLREGLPRLQRQLDAGILRSTRLLSIACMFVNATDFACRFEAIRASGPPAAHEAEAAECVIDCQTQIVNPVGGVGADIESALIRDGRAQRCGLRGAAEHAQQRDQTEKCFCSHSWLFGYEFNVER